MLLLVIAADRATVAVLAGGVDRAYPAKHATLLERIVATDLVVESPCARVPRNDPGGTDPARRPGLARCRDRLWKLVRSCTRELRYAANRVELMLPSRVRTASRRKTRPGRRLGDLSPARHALVRSPATSAKLLPRRSIPAAVADQPPSTAHAVGARTTDQWRTRWAG